MVPSSVRITNAPMIAPTIPPTVLLGLNGDSGRRAQRHAAQSLSATPRGDVGGRDGEAQQKRVRPHHHEV